MRVYIETHKYLALLRAVKPKESITVSIKVKPNDGTILGWAPAHKAISD